MAQISRPILYTVLLGVVVFAAVTLTGSEDTPKKGVKKTTKAASKADGDFTEEDYKAEFARYVGGKRNAFLPKIIPAKATDVVGVGHKPNPMGVWSLTGISVNNKVPTAILENSATQEIQFVQKGDKWNGFRVVAIAAEAITLVNAQKQQMRLTFVAPDAFKPPQNVGATTQNATAPLGIAPMPVLPPMPANSRQAVPAPLTTRERSVTNP